MNRSSPGRRLRAQRLTLAFGGLYDLGFAIAMLLAPQAIASAFALPLPGPPFYLPLLSVLLTMLAALYLAAAYDLRRLAVVPWVAGIGRLAGAIMFATCAMRDPALRSLWLMAGVDGLLGVLHLVLARNTGVATTR